MLRKIYNSVLNTGQAKLKVNLKSVMHIIRRFNGYHKAVRYLTTLHVVVINLFCIEHRIYSKQYNFQYIATGGTSLFTSRSRLFIDLYLSYVIHSAYLSAYAIFMGYLSRGENPLFFLNKYYGGGKK